MKSIKNTILVLLFGGLLLASTQVNAQNKMNVITTGVPFLNISPDARGGSMGDAGVASSPTASSMFWNPAKYAFVENDMGMAIGYSPWLRSIVDDIGLSSLFFYKRLDDLQTIGVSLRYFSLGDVNFTDNQGHDIGKYSPNEFAIDGAYARKLSDYFSLAVAGRFIYSNLTSGVANDEVGDSGAGTSYAADIALYYRREINFSNMDGEFAFGANISNIGAKISYTDIAEKDFIPTNLRFGPALSINLDDYNKMEFALDVNKLLVPTPPIMDPDNNEVILRGKSNDVNVITGIFQSMYDAPDGFSEELKEFSFALGAEYWYDNTFALRGGLFYEDKTKGDRKYATLGAGLKYNVFALDVSYLVSIGSKSPLDNTLRFTLHFDFENFF